jgi:hypothetical protein
LPQRFQRLHVKPGERFLFPIVHLCQPIGAVLDGTRQYQRQSQQRFSTLTGGVMNDIMINLRSPVAAGHFGLHSRASLCASAICAGVILDAATSRL